MHVSFQGQTRFSFSKLQLTKQILFAFSNFYLIQVHRRKMIAKKTSSVRLNYFLENFIGSRSQVFPWIVMLAWLCFAYTLQVCSVDSGNNRIVGLKKKMRLFGERPIFLVISEWILWGDSIRYFSQTCRKVTLKVK